MTSPAPRTQGTHTAEASGARSNEIFGTGEMADLTRSFDWSQTPVGPVEQWPDALLITVNTILASRHPMFLWWGEQLVQFYNAPDEDLQSLRRKSHVVGIMNQFEFKNLVIRWQ